MNLFYYTLINKENPEAPKLIGSFNVEKIIRTLQMEDGTTLVLLDDLHERTVSAPVFDKSGRKVVSHRSERNTYQSEIYLNSEDAQYLRAQLGLV